MRPSSSDFSPQLLDCEKKKEQLGRQLTYTVAIFLDFHSTKQGQPLADFWSYGLGHIVSSNVPRSGYIIAPDQSMVESGVTEGGKNTVSFLFRE